MSVKRAIVELPSDPSARVAALVERSAPRGVSISKEMDAIDRRDAGCYASMEDLSARCQLLVKRIDAHASVVPVPFVDEDSAVHHINEAKEALKEK